MTESHIRIYCDCCGQVYAEEASRGHAAKGICFTSLAQAVDCLNANSAPWEWFYDGDRVLCPACRFVELGDAEFNDLYSKD
ncbi:hypothetical protein AB0H49_29595 [Nocardia sp. NPDC050713]|uniref:hypothetical protein n=1 Tax=Nocardia sp. NPDC050713 TaxID=3154511 RepID=UPI0033D183B4